MSLGKEADPPRAVPEWLVTFSDVMSLLLTFFVMLLTFSTADREQFDKASGSLRGAMGVATSDHVRLPQTGMLEERHTIGGRSSPTGMDFPPEYEPLAWEVHTWNYRLKNDKTGQELSLQMLSLSRGVLIRIPAALLFAKQGSRLTQRGEEILARIAKTSASLKNEVEIIGHLGSDFIPQQRTAWAVSIERASAAAELFRRAAGIEPARLIVGGKGTSHSVGRKPAAIDDRLDITLLVRQREL